VSKDIDSWMLPADIICLAVVFFWWLRRASQQPPGDCQREIGLGLAVCLVSTVLSQVASIPLNARYMLALVPLFWTPSLVIAYYLAQCCQAYCCQAYCLDDDNQVRVPVGARESLNELWSVDDLLRLSHETERQWVALEGGGGAADVGFEAWSDSDPDPDLDTDTDSLASTQPDRLTASSLLDRAQDRCCPYWGP
jgi:hypothetical protein